MLQYNQAMTDPARKEVFRRALTSQGQRLHVLKQMFCRLQYMLVGLQAVDLLIQQIRSLYSLQVWAVMVQPVEGALSY